MADSPGLSFKTPGKFNRKKNIAIVRRISGESTDSKAFDWAMQVAINVYKLREEIADRASEDLLGKVLGGGREEGFSFRQKHLNTSLDKFEKEAF